MANTLLSNTRPAPLKSRLHYLVVAVVVLAGMSASDRQSVMAQAPETSFVCFPTCDVGDSRFIGIAGASSASLAGQAVFIGLSSSPFSAAIPISIFDGDAKPTATGRWDNSFSAPKLLFELYADPAGDLSGLANAPLATWQGGDGVNAPTMPDNAWYELPDPGNGNQAPFMNRAAAQKTGCPECPYEYVLKVRPDPAFPEGFGVSNFKVRSGGTVSAKPVAFAFYGSRQPNDAASVSTSTYDGTWDFDFFVKTGQTSLTIYDGDSDYGSADCLNNDTDDPDSPDYPDFVPTSERGGTPALAEGLAVTTTLCSPAIGTQKTSGSPADDNASAILRRSPTASTVATWSNPLTSPDGTAHTVANIVYTLTAPDGSTYLNDNPSGQQEWEQFRIDTAPFERNLMDYHTPGSAGGFLPSGIWRLRLEGQDLNNLSAWRMAFESLGRDKSNNPAPPGAFYAVGGRAFYDQGAIGTFDNDPPLGGVELGLVDAQNNVIATAVSDPIDGSYEFRVSEGTYTVRVLGPPSGLYPTTQSGTYPDQPGLAVGATTFAAEANFGFRNQPPIANDDATETLAGTPVSITVLGNDSDPEGTMLTVVSFTAPPASEGVVTQSGNVLTFTPAPGFVGVSTFTYTIRDADGGTATATVRVAVKLVTVVVTGGPFDYDGNPHGATCTVTADDGAILTGTLSYAPLAGAPVNAGSYPVVCDFPGDATHSPASGSGTIVINPRPVTVTASSHNLTYGDPVPTVTASYSGFVAGDSVASLSTAPSCTTAYTPASPGGTTPSTSCSGATATNYTFVYVAGTVTIAKKPVVVTILPVVVPYDGTPKSATCLATDGLAGTITYSGISPTVYGPTETAPTAAGTYASSCTVPGGPGHEGPTTTTSTVTIQKATVTVTASSHTVTFGAAVPTISPSYSGFVGGETDSVLTIAPTCTTAYTPASPAGTSPSTSCSGAAAANYEFVYVNGSVSINAAQGGDYRMTGGGTFGVATHGFTLHCNIQQGSNNLEVNWGKGNKFHLENLTAATCFTDPTIKPAPPSAPFNTYVGKGSGRYNGAPATAEWTFTDAGEPGTKDKATIVIRNASGSVVLSTSGNISKGNQQAHK